jgi:gamma-glutamyltranspeptidase
VAIAYNGSGRASAELNCATLHERGTTSMPERGTYTVTVPGCVRSWEDVGRAHGTRGLDELLEPAERYARDGFVATDVTAELFERNEALLRADADAAALFLRGGIPRAGDLLHNSALAASLGAIRRKGAQAFYEGPIADAICATLTALGNPMRPSDLDWLHLAIEAFKEAYDARDARFAATADSRSVLHDIYERGMTVQAAIDAPRFVYGRDSESAYGDAVRVESRFDARLVAGLRARGHVVEILGAYDHRAGHAHAIAIDQARGTLAGASDPRADSLALGL